MRGHPGGLPEHIWFSCPIEQIINGSSVCEMARMGGNEAVPSSKIFVSRSPRTAIPVSAADHAGFDEGGHTTRREDVADGGRAVIVRKK